MKFMGDYIHNDMIEVNEKPMDANSISYIRSILDFIEMISDISLNQDPEITKFFLEDSIQKFEKKKWASGKKIDNKRSPQAFLPLYVLIEFLKKE